MPARDVEGHALAGEEHLHVRRDRLAGLQQRRLGRPAGEDHVPHLLDVAAGQGVQEPQVALGQVQPGADLAGVVTGVGEHHLGDDVLPDEDLVREPELEPQVVGVVLVDQPLGVGRLGQAGGQAAVSPAEPLPARPHLRVRASGSARSGRAG